MTGDYTRMSFRPRKRFSTVREQQGRVQLDSDWNEQSDILRERVRLLSLDSFGPVGVPYLTTPDAFKLGLIPGAPPNLSIEPGRLYVDGLLAELFADEAASYAAQPFLPDAPALPAGNSLAYLDIWEREVTYVEDPDLLDVALGGVDTTARLQTVWQLRVDAVPKADCGMPVGEPPSAGRLTTAAIAPPAPDDPCILPPIQGYRGLENRLYRVEILQGGALGVARFAWSRDNGTLVAPVSDLAVSGAQTTLAVQRIGRDDVMRFRVGDWVKVTDDHRELHGEPGEMAQIANINEADREIVLDRGLPTVGGRAFGAGPGAIAARHTRIQKWDQTATLNTLDGNGLILTGAGPVSIEAGIEITFTMDPAGGNFRVGDFWQFWARTATAEIEILTAAPPRGIEHHYVQLGAISGLGGPAPAIEDCRPKARPDGCCTFVVRPGENIQEAIDSLPPAGGCVCLKAGLHEVDDTIVIGRSDVTLHGESMGAIVRRRDSGLVLLVGQVRSFATREIRISSIVFQSGKGGQDSDPVVGVAGAERVVIDDCRIESPADGYSNGLVIYNSIDVTVSGCVFTGAVIGAWCFGGCRDLTISACDFRSSDGREAIIGFAVLAQTMAGPIIVEDNVVTTPLFGIVVNDDPTGNPGAFARGSRVCGNRIFFTRRPDLPQRAFAIDVAAEASVVNDNQIEHQGGNLTGIRLCGSGSAAHGNVIRCRRGEEWQAATGAGQGPETAVAIMAGWEVNGVYMPLERLVIADNIIEGEQHGIALGGTARSRVNGNILGDTLSATQNAIALQRASECVVSENIIRRFGFGVLIVSGARNTVSENCLEGGNFGIGVFTEEAPTISGNRLTDLARDGILLWVAAQRCNLVANRIIRCGSAASAASGIGAWAIGGELHVEANELMDLGISSVVGAAMAPLAYGIVGDGILEARIESNLITYSAPNLRSVDTEDRALLMRGLSDVPAGRQTPGAGFAIQIINNKFIGPGASALVELFEGKTSDGVLLRFQRVLFHGNYCAHFSSGFTSGPRAIAFAAPAFRGVTVKLVGRHCSITGNHVTATTPGFPSYRLIDSARTDGEMMGPFIGNVSNAGHSGRSAQTPSPESSFNTIA